MPNPNPGMDLQADITDLELLLSKAKRPRVRAMLTDYLGSMRAELATRKTDPDAMDISVEAPAGAPEPEAAPIKKMGALPPSAPPPEPVKIPTAPAPTMTASGSAGGSSIEYRPIQSMAWDQSEYGAEPNYVMVYVTSGVDGVGAIKDQVSCDFKKDAFDLKIHGLNGKNYRLHKFPLDKAIDPDRSKLIVKKDSIKLKLAKPKGKYGYDTWMDLTAKKPKLDENGKEKDPGASLMDMMKDMYDQGDDTMKKTLAEAMIKSREREAQGLPPDSLDDKDDF